MAENQDKNLLARPPIVVVMGHIDHGKSSLLDFIRRTNVVGKEAGGITQSIGAYEIKHNDKRITFIDTPGHEIFSKMRERGANVADLGILVVAADEGVKPQTKEAIKILKEVKTPFVVAVNKIDKPNANVEKTKTDLMEAGIILEGFGGDVSWQAISAKTGEGIKDLLDLILLAAEVEKLIYNPEVPAKGIIIEAELDCRRGVTATAIVKDGTLKLGDEIATPTTSGKIKILENFLGEQVEKLEPSSPALILGFEKLPQTGEEFFAGKTELWEIKMPQTPQKVEPAKTEPEISVVEDESKVNLILKADVSGSLEALCQVIKTLPDARIVREAVGDITDGDVKSALSGKAIIVGFNVKTSKAAENLAKAQDVKIITSAVIYELLKNLETELETFRKPVVNGQLEILAIFGKKNGSVKSRRQVIGGRVLVGSFKNNSWAEIKRGEEKIGEGKIINLQKGKQDVGQAGEGEECGLLIESETAINVGDQLII